MSTSLENTEHDSQQLAFEYQMLLDALAATVVEFAPTVTALIELANSHPAWVPPIKGSNLLKNPWPRVFLEWLEGTHLRLVDKDLTIAEAERARREESVNKIHLTIRDLVLQIEEEQRRKS